MAREGVKACTEEGTEASFTMVSLSQLCNCAEREVQVRRTVPHTE